MDEMINYIFGSLRSSDKAVKSISSTLNKQMKINRSLKFFVLGVTINLIVSGIDRRNQIDRINKLEKEIEKLKCSEGD